MMKELNELWKKKNGRDLTQEEAWKMVEFVKMLYENADRNIDEELKKKAEA